MIGADDTPYPAVEQGIKRLRRVNAPLLGCVLNRVVAAQRGYGYGYRYGYGKHANYGSDYG